MDKLLVHGGATLRGAINISGSKNASLPILAAAILTGEDCIIGRVPDVSDTNYMVQILSALGANVEPSSGTARISCAEIAEEAPYDLVRRMRASICVMGPLLARKGRAVVSLPGGCIIGDRPVDLHLRGLEALGAKVEFAGGNMILTAPDGLRGAEIDLQGTHGPTVLGTDNVMMAATLAEGVTVIESAAALAGDNVTLRRVCRDHLKAITAAILKAGHQVDFNAAGDLCTVSRGEDPKGCDLVTSPYPGYPTDMQAQMTALFATTPGLRTLTCTCSWT